MPRSLTSRLLAIALSAIVGFAVPGEALAHGMAHRWEHRGDPHHRVADDHDVAPALSAPDHDHDHQHPRLDGATRTRVDGLTLVVVLPMRMPEARLLNVAHSTPIQRAPLARGDPHTGPPPRLRAPPAR